MTFYKKSCSRLSSSGTCDICNTRRGYVNTLGGGCSLLSSLWCNVMNPQGACLSCRNGYFPVGGKCAVVNPVANCISYASDDARCIDCDKNYFLNINGTCTLVAKPIDNCALHRDTTTCKRCAKDYIVQNGRCVAAVPNCRVQNGMVCNACSPNTFPVAAPTVPTSVMTPDFWAQDFNLNTRGWSSTLLNTNPSCVMNKDPACATATSPDVCTACKPGFYLSTQGACLAVTASKLDANCVQYSNANTCAACRPGAYLVSGACVANPALQTVPRCVYYSAPGQCDRCMATFAFNGVTCAPVDANKVDTACEVYDFGGMCRHCNLATSKKYSSKGVCTDLVAAQTLANCASHSSAGCVVCSPGYYLAADKTCALVLNAPIKNCGVYADPATCTECITGYLLVEKVCTNIFDANCAMPEKTGKCTACVNGFEPTSGNCVATTAIPRCYAMSAPATCAMCKDNFMISLDQKSCVPSAQATSGCLEYNNSTGCRVCPSGKYYDSNSNTCNTTTATVTDCYNYTSATTCVACTAKYLDTATTCAGTVLTNCAIQGSEATKCIYCTNTHYRDMTTSACTVIAGSTVATPIGLITNCANYAANPTTTATACDRCSPEYYLTSIGTCAPVATVVTSCSSYNATGTNGIITGQTCVRCLPDYKPNASPIASCASVTAITNCYLYSVTAAVCQYCAVGMRPDATGATCAAMKPITNCEIYATTSTCSRCTVGNVPSADGTTCVTASIAAPVTGCSRYAQSGSTFTCTNCTTGYYFVPGNNTCVTMGTPLANCKYQSAPYTCHVCNKGYYPNASGVCTAVTTTTTNCDEYKDAATCSLCAPGFHLDNTYSCVALTGIAGCGNYTNSTSCSNCTSGFFLNTTSGACVAASGIAGCDIYASASACAACVPGKAMTPGGTQCFDNCETATATACTKCAPNAFLSNGTCTPVNSITGCSYYSSASACSQCMESYALSADNTTCTYVREAANCANLSAPAAGCSLCEIGYTLNNGQCVAGSIAPTEACRLPRDATNCDVCGVRYYNQGSIGTCKSVDVR